MNTATILKATNSDIYSKNIITRNLNLGNTIKQVCELTGCSNDEAATTLFDYNYDIERTVDKIFENIKENDLTDNAWKEVAKPKKKLNFSEIINVHSKEIIDNKQRSNRGNVRGRPRNVRSNVRSFDNNEFESVSSNRLHERRTYDNRSTMYRSYSKSNCNEDFDRTIEIEPEDDVIHKTGDYPIQTGNEWLSDEGETDSKTIDCVAQLESLSVNHPLSNPIDIAIKDSDKNCVFGDYSKTKAPPTSKIIPTEAVNLMTSTGIIISSPTKTVFNFGLDFAELCRSESSVLSERVNIETVADICDEENLIRLQISQNEKQRIESVSEDPRLSHCDENHPTLILGYENVPSRIPANEDRSSHKTHHRDNVTFASSLPVNRLCDPSILSDSTFSSAVTSATQVCPPGMSTTGHFLHNQQYLSLMNLTNNPEPQIHHHSIDSKDFYQPLQQSYKSIDPHEHDQTKAAILNAMQMSNICCYPPPQQQQQQQQHQMFMNNYGQSSIDMAQSQHQQQQNKQLYPHGNYNNEEFSDPTKYGRVEPHYMPLSPVKDGKDDKMKPIGVRAHQQPMSHDPRYMAYQHQHSQQHHPYPGNLYNCVPPPPLHSHGASTGASQHSYSMANQQAQMNLLQQQLHNFSPSFQFPEHLMPSMMPSANSRSSSGSGQSQSRGTRPNNVLWHPSS